MRRTVHAPDHDIRDAQEEHALRHLVDQVGLLRQAATEATREYERARSQLAALMTKRRAEGVPADGEHYQAVLEKGRRRTIDPALLRATVDDGIFLQCVSVVLAKAEALLDPSVLVEVVRERDLQAPTLRLTQRPPTE
jgi:hypothetical protein